MNKCIYSHCEICHIYKRIEVDNKLYKDLKRLGLIYGESKVFTICQRCMNRMKEGVDEDNE